MLHSKTQLSGGPALGAHTGCRPQLSKVLRSQWVSRQHAASSGKAGQPVQQQQRPARCAASTATQTDTPSLARRAAQGAASAALALLALGSGPGGAALAAADAPPFYDQANVVAKELRGGISQSLVDLERDAGWKVRVYSAYGGVGLKDSSSASPRQLWGPPDQRTLWVKVDPSSPNILNMIFVGDDVLFKLRRPFLQEVQSRYGNLFFVRDNGESAAVEQAVGVLAQCLAAPEGCKVVPGLPSDQYFFTLAFSVTGGLIAGFVSRIKPQGIVKRQWVWLLIFSPLWASLFVNFGLGPVVSRTSDAAPVLANTAGFLAAAALTYLDRLAAPRPQEGDGGGAQ